MHEELAGRLRDAIAAMTPLQREAVRRCTDLGEPQGPMYVVVNHAPENQVLIDAMRTAFLPGERVDAATVSELRAALDDLPLDCLQAFSNAIFVIIQENIWDDKWAAVEGGGIEFTYPTPRVYDFIRFVNEEADRFINEEADEIGVQIATALDVGCWQGSLICELLQRGYAVGGTDVGDTEATLRERLAMLRPEDAARFLGYSRGWAHEVLEATAPESYDMVLSEQTLEHIPTALLQRTCDAMLRVARCSLILDVPGWDDGFPLHLRVYTLEDFERLFVRGGWKMEVLAGPGGGVYTMVKFMRK